MKENKIDIIPCIPIGDSYPLNYYQMYYEYQKELAYATNDLKIIKEIQSETELITHYNRGGGSYTDNLVFTNNKAIGLICYQVVDWLEDNKPIIIYIDHFYIRKEYQHKGYGTKLLNTISKKYKKAVIYFYVLKDNNPAQKFWPKAIEKNKMIRIRDDRCEIEQEEEAIETCDKFIIKRA